MPNKPAILKAKELQINNEVNMVVRPGNNLYFPITDVKTVAGKIALDIHGSRIEVDPEQQFQVDLLSMTRDQRQDRFGTFLITRTAYERKDTHTHAVYTVEGKDELVVDLFLDTKIFRIQKWPSWMPERTLRVNDVIGGAKTFAKLERMISSLAAANVKRGKKTLEERVSFATWSRMYKVKAI